MTRPQPFNRRRFIRGLGAGALMVPAFTRSLAHAAADPDAVFAHGVASGDPLAHRVIIWTRVQPGLAGAVPVRWEVALDPGFRQIVRHGEAIAQAASDHTVKVDVTALPADTPLHYRFRAAGQWSTTGRTRTLPVGAVAQVKLAVMSCSNYPAGYFHAFADLARQDGLHAALHLGDFIYEYEIDGYASGDAAALGRLSDPANELSSLADYRRRHAQYRTDPDLQAAHAALPFICVWDDHEIANDAWTGGAQNHDPLTEGDYALRRAAAMQAYHEWMPIRSPDPARPEHIYRSFAFGDLLDLHMLDTRHVGRDRQLNFSDYADGGFDLPGFLRDLNDPRRQVLGQRQLQWLKGRMADTGGTWTVLGQQVQIARMLIPLPVALGEVGIVEYMGLHRRAQAMPSSLTPTERALLGQPGIPFNLDAWDGYYAAREAVLGAARSLDKNLVVLAGDTHNAWASNLTDRAGREIGVEFATPGVSSPGLEAYLPGTDPAELAAFLEALIEPLVYANTADRGYMILTATPHECRAEWRYVSSVKVAGYTAFTGKVLRTLPGAGSRHIVPV